MSTRLERAGIVGEAVKRVLGPNKALSDAPWNRPIKAGDTEAIRQAGLEGQRIREETDKIREDVLVAS